MNNEIENDCGTKIIDCLLYLKKYGACPEFSYIYDIKKINTIPNKLSYQLSKFCKLVKFIEITRNDIKKNLLKNNLIICGIKIFNSFHNPITIKTGYVKLPKNNISTENILHFNENILLGGHSIIIIGFDDNTSNYKFINSWGMNWGDNGYGYIPYDYINNVSYADEFFILKKITNMNINNMSNNLSNHQGYSLIITILLMSILLILRTI